MSRYNAPFEIHVHGEVPLRTDVTFAQIQDALKPLWKYAGARSLADGAHSAYEEEPGIKFDATGHLLQLCWTVQGDDDFRQVLDEMCMNLNELCEQGAAIEGVAVDIEAAALLPRIRRARGLVGDHLEREDHAALAHLGDISGASVVVVAK